MNHLYSDIHSCWYASACLSLLIWPFLASLLHLCRVTQLSWSWYLLCLYSHHSFPVCTFFHEMFHHHTDVLQENGCLSKHMLICRVIIFELCPFCIFIFFVDLTFLHESCKTFHGELVNFEKMVSDDACAQPCCIASRSVSRLLWEIPLYPELLFFSYSIKLQKWWGASGGTGVLS